MVDKISDKTKIWLLACMIIALSFVGILTISSLTEKLKRSESYNRMYQYKYYNEHTFLSLNGGNIWFKQMKDSITGLQILKQVTKQSDEDFKKMLATEKFYDYIEKHKTLSLSGDNKEFEIELLEGIGFKVEDKKTIDNVETKR